MDILVRGIPVQTTESALRDFFKPVLGEFAIVVFNCKKTKNKPIAILTIADSAKAELFLKKYGQPQSLVDFEPLLFINKPLKISASTYKPPDELILKTLRYEEEELLRKATRKARRQPDPENPPDQPLIVLKRPRLQRAFDFSSLWCGVWDYNGSQAAFAPHFQDTRRGTIMFGKRTLAMVLRADGWVTSTCRIDIPYWSIDTVVTCSQLNKVTFTLRFAPRVYKLEDGLEGLMSGLGISAPNSRRYQRFNRTRVSAIDESHELVVGSCFIYQITLSNPLDTSKLDYLVRKNPGMPPILSLPTSYTQAHVTFKQDFERLKSLIYAQGQFGTLKFSVKFQVERLARNAYLPPAKVVALLPTIKQLSKEQGHDIIHMDEDVMNERGHIFSDGVGRISYKLLRRVWKEYQQARGQRPTCLQIRLGGAKGVVSLDDRLLGERLCLRPSMVKFHGSATWNIEICGANFKPLPMYLNRQFIKILEDLGVDAHVFLDLQNNMIEQLRRITKSPINAATFLEHARVVQATRMPYLFRMLDEMGLSFNEDDFMSHVVEIAALSQLRDIKHRSRILVERGVTLYGIMDETGFLGEDEIYCVIERLGDNGRPKRTVICGGEVIVTRSPAMHPGDIQKAQAVDVPPDSPLQALSNVVVFSAKGQRDLPSQLSGGDLDGDLYNVIFDRRLMPRVTYMAADYKKVPPLDIGRPVMRQDITDFFLKFMETDQLGRISMNHMQLADRRPNGTLDPDCLKLAEMASTAVDFSKTGIPVDMSQFPKNDLIRPDFMASGPRVIVEKKGIVFHEDEDDDLLDEDDAVSALDPDFKTFRYYESERVLGQLYRAIDEKKIFQEMQRHATETKSHLGGLNLMDQVWSYVLRETALIQWEEYKGLARNIRETYESNLLDIMSDYSTHPQYPLSELEVFGGNIIGKSTGAQNRRTRERTMEMNERFERDVIFTVERITQGDDGDRDEALARSIACLAIGITEQHRINKRVGELRSWKYIAAAVCLREIELFKIRFDPLNRI
ncbi:RNA-dependent RNA polymerase eukaryotic-type [Neofusicoccum parvum]|uniref:RNA-dependent RNA polymerase eukaryotic-type n=1 Tax=Neofusicoccum parvum TaxID=310453 RepID=A0ACB5RNM2_9PEZI|nr:RNA-dependent RNA polymerase eukaryotic-type [Neofusicoccum parvum]